MALNKNILLIYLTPPESLGKSAQMLTLKYLKRLGWTPTVITVPREGISRDPVINWCGIDVFTVNPSGSRLWRLSRSLYQARSRAIRRNTERNGHIRLPGIDFPWGNYALLPATAALSFPDRYRWATSEILSEAQRLHKVRAFQAVLSGALPDSYRGDSPRPFMLLCL